MEVAELAATRRVAMVVPPRAHVVVPIADLRADPDSGGELVDQAHYAEQLTVLASRQGWHCVQAIEDHYFGWISENDILVFTGSAGPGGVRRVGVVLAAVRRSANATSDVLGYLPAGTLLAPHGEQDEGEFVQVALGRPSPVSGPRTGYVAISDAVDGSKLPRRPPTADDLLATAEAFHGVPYLWGGTTALGLDCSGFVQQVYRLNGIRLDRDADQQATEGRAVETPREGDLVFFGAGRVTHVGLATGEREIIHAPQAGGRVVERWALGPERTVLAVRRYLP